jgi:hypothetical protein
MTKTEIRQQVKDQKAQLKLRDRVNSIQNKCKGGTVIVEYPSMGPDVRRIYLFKKLGVMDIRFADYIFEGKSDGSITAIIK